MKRRSRIYKNRGLGSIFDEVMVVMVVLGIFEIFGSSENFGCFGMVVFSEI